MAGKRDRNLIVALAVLGIILGGSILGGLYLVGTQFTTVPQDEKEDIECTMNSDCPQGYECFKGSCMEIAKKDKCDSTTTPSVDVLVIDKHTGAAVTDTNFSYRREGSKRWVEDIADGATNLALSPFELVDVAFWGNGSTYYGKYIEGWEVPCEEDPDPLEVELPNIATASSMSWVVKNDDDSINENTNGQAIGTGAPISISMKIKGQYEDEYGSIHPGLTDEDGQVCKGNILQVKLNRTAFEDVTSTLGNAWEPEQITGDANNDTYYFWVPPIVSSGEDGSTGYFTLNLNPDDTNQPTVESNFTMTLYDCQIYLNDDTYEVQHSTEDYKGDDDVGQATELTKTVYVT